MTTHGEKCVRCGEVDEDRRTLWMACFYAMEELKIPFEQTVLFHADVEKLEKVKDAVGFDTGNGQRINIAPPTLKTSAELTPQGFYTLRVCKECRADWMAAIQMWFVDKAAQVDRPSPGTGIFVRRNGTNVEVTEEEWRNLRNEREKP